MMAAAGKFEDLFTRWIEAVKIAMPRSSLDCVTVGMQLAMVKAASAPGTFWDRVNALGFTKSEAVKYMACARRFDPRRDAVLLASVDAPSKLLALLCLSDEEVLKLGGGGEARGLTLDGVAAMTEEQLCQALGQSESRDGVRLSADEERMLRNYRKLKPEVKAHVGKLTELLAAAS